jgi:hypothetical protein
MTPASAGVPLPKELPRSRVGNAQLGVELVLAALLLLARVAGTKSASHTSHLDEEVEGGCEPARCARKGRRGRPCRPLRGSRRYGQTRLSR